MGATDVTSPDAATQSEHGIVANPNSIVLGIERQYRYHWPEDFFLHNSH